MSALDDAELLLSRLDSVQLASVTGAGYPRVREMEIAARDGLLEFWFGTKRSSNKVCQFRRNPKAGVSFCVGDDCVSLTGDVELVEDREALLRFWSGEQYARRLAVDADGPVYCLLRFRSAEGTAFLNGKFTELRFNPAQMQ